MQIKVRDIMTLVKERLEDRDIPLQELSIRTGLSAASLSRTLNMTRKPNFNDVVSMLNAVGYEVIIRDQEEQ